MAAAAATLLLPPAHSSIASYTPFTPLPFSRSSAFCAGRPPRLSTASLPAQLHCPFLPIRAASSEETSTESSSEQLDELLSDLKTKWDGIENKSTLFVYGGGALFALWLSTTIVTAINSVPLLPKVMELVGLGYTGWFVYRYLLFKESRKELASDIEELKAKIAGTQKDIE